MDTQRVDIRICARCFEDHSGLEFSRFSRPLNVEVSDPVKGLVTAMTYEWWAMCPQLHEPLIMHVVQTQG